MPKHPEELVKRLPEESQEGGSEEENSGSGSEEETLGEEFDEPGEAFIGDDEEEEESGDDDEEFLFEDNSLDSLNDRSYEVYGGRVTGIAAAEIEEGVTLLAVATESANFVFYAEIDWSEEEPFEEFIFEVIPSMSSVSNLEPCATYCCAFGIWYYFWSQSRSVDCGRTRF